MLPYAEWTALLGSGLTCFLVMTKRAFCLRVYADGLMMGVFILSVFLASEWNVIFPTITIPTLSLTPPIESWIRRTDITRLTWEMPGMQKRHFFQKFGISVCCLGASTCQDGKPKIRVRSHPILNLHSTKWLKITPATLWGLDRVTVTSNFPATFGSEAFRVIRASQVTTDGSTCHFDFSSGKPRARFLFFFHFSGQNYEFFRTSIWCTCPCIQ